MEPGACTDGAVGQLEKLVVFLGRDVSRIASVGEMVLRFHQRGTRELEVSGEFLRPEATEPF
jgi:hypothetical protein